MIAGLSVLMLAVEYMDGDEEVALCGPAQDVWDILREEYGWYAVDPIFDRDNSTFILWWRHGAMKLYINGGNS